MNVSTTLEATRPFVRQGVLAQTLRDALVLLRPRGIPVQLLFALTGYAMGAPARDPRTLVGDLAILLVGWAVLLAGGTNQFNSAFDRDLRSITLLDDPPAPPRGLAAIGLVAMTSGALIFALRSWAAATFGLVLTGAGVIYSYGFGLRRIKDIPVLDIVWHGLGYGLGAAAMGYLLTGAALTTDFWCLGIGSSISLAAAAIVAQMPRPGQIDYERKTFTTLVGPQRAWLVAAAFYAVGGVIAMGPWLLRMPTESLLVDGLVLMNLTMLLTCAKMCLGFADAPLANDRARTSHLAIVLVGRVAFVVAAWVYYASA